MLQWPSISAIDFHFFSKLFPVLFLVFAHVLASSLGLIKTNRPIFPTSVCGSLFFLSLVAATGYLLASSHGTGIEVGWRRKWKACTPVRMGGHAAPVSFNPENSQVWEVAMIPQGNVAVSCSHNSAA